jgi:hypothetical protein
MIFIVSGKGNDTIVDDDNRSEHVTIEESGRIENQTSITEDLISPDEVTFNGVVRWASTTEVANSNVLIDDNDNVTVPGNMVIEGDISVNGSSTFTQLVANDVSDQTKSLGFNFANVPTNTQVLLTLPSTNLDLSTITQLVGDTTVVMSGSTYSTVFDAISDGKYDIFIPAGQNIIETTNISTGASNILITIASGAVWDLNTRSLTMSLGSSQLSIIGSRHTKSIDSLTLSPSIEDSVVQFDSSLTTFLIGPTGVTPSTVSCFNIDLVNVSTVDNVGRFANIDVIQEYNLCAIFYQDNQNAFTIGDATVLPHIMRDTFLYRSSSGTITSPIIDLSFVLVENAWFINTSIVKVSNSNLLSVGTINSNFEFDMSSINNLSLDTSSSNVSVLCKNSTRYSDCTDKVDMTIEGDNVSIVNSEIGLLTMSSLTGNNTIISGCVIDSSLDLVIDVLTTNFKLESNTISIDSLTVSSEIAHIHGNTMVSGGGILIDSNNVSIQDNNITALTGNININGDGINLGLNIVTAVEILTIGNDVNITGCTLLANVTVGGTSDGFIMSGCKIGTLSSGNNIVDTKTNEGTITNVLIASNSIRGSFDNTGSSTTEYGNLVYI